MAERVGQRREAGSRGSKGFSGGDSNGYGGGGDQGGRKRRNESDGDFVDRKKGAYEGGHDDGCHLKLLMSNMVAGAIIGKGAENIKNIQKDTGVKIQISKAHDFYPGTQERVCLIGGPNADKILDTFDFILEKLFEKKDPDDNSNDDEVTLKLVIANSSAGMIIGKAGSTIKQIKESTGCHYLNISQKSDDSGLRERLLTAVGTKPSLKQAVTTVLEKISEDPHGVNLDLSYGGMGNYNNEPMHGGRSQGNMTPFSNIDPFSVSQASSGGAFNLGALAAMQQFSSNSNSVNLSINLNTAGQTSSAGQLGQSFERIKIQLRQCGLTDFQIMEVYTALNTLAKYGVLGINSGQNDLGNKVLGAIGKVLEECLIAKTLQVPPMQPPPLPDMGRFSDNPSSNSGGGGRSSRWGERDRRN